MHNSVKGEEVSIFLLYFYNIYATLSQVYVGIIGKVFEDGIAAEISCR
jgi:hypothetical protein